MNKVPQNKINWGRNLWNILHFITTRYDTSLRKEYEVFFTKIVPIILTCKKCSDNYKNHIKLLKIDLSSREALVFWLYKIHNRTNKNLNKEEYPFEKFNDKLKNYNYFKRTASNSTTTYIVYMQKHLKCDNLKLKIAFSKFISFIFSQCAF